MSSGAGASPQSRQRRRRRALPRSRGAGAASAEPPASCPAGAEGSAAAPGRQRCKCPALGAPGGCQALSAGFGGHSGTARAGTPSYCAGSGTRALLLPRVPGAGALEEGGCCAWVLPCRGKGPREAQLTSRSPCRCSLQIQPAFECCGGTSCPSPAWSSLQMTGSSFRPPRTAPSSNASVPLGPRLAVPPA